MKVGDLVKVLFETPRYYIIIEKIPRSQRGFGEQMYTLMCREDGTIRHDVRYSTIKVIRSFQDR